MFHFVESAGFPSRRQIIVLANREPYSHHRSCDGSVALHHCPSGVVNAVEPLLGTWRGVWVAHGSGSGDHDVPLERDGLDVPHGDSRYRLRRVWLGDAEERGYYDGFANGALWPLCHRAHVQPAFHDADFEAYRIVNARFAGAVCDEAEGADPVVLVQDYHFALAPQTIRERLPHSTIVAFWHIPWPQWQTFAICPQGRPLIEGMLCSDIVGFQTAIDCENFIDTVEQLLGLDVDRVRSTVAFQGRAVAVNHYPTSIEWPGQWTAVPPVDVCRAVVRRELRLDERVLLGIGVDRLDYTKGVEEKFLIIEQLLESYPGFRDRFVFVQLAQPTRRRVTVYRETRARVLATASRINRRFCTRGHQPILLLEANHTPRAIARHFRAADVCFVNSLHDGMNLVSKEFVAARDDEQGTLVVSSFAGAAAELTDAVLMNPYDRSGGAAALAEALSMSPERQRQRMRRMREIVARNDARHWAGRVIGDALASRRQPNALQLQTVVRAFS